MINVRLISLLSDAYLLRQGGVKILPLKKVTHVYILIDTTIIPLLLILAN